MNRKVKRELKEFLEFKSNYAFNQKQLIEKEGKIYCEDELVSDGDDILIGESDKWINVGFKIKEPLPKMLSNLFPYEFKFKGKKLSSMEGFFQGIKFVDKKVQNYVLKYTGIQAVYTKYASDYDWRETGYIYWQGKKINRFSKEYELLIDELYISAIQNPLYRLALLKSSKPLIHSIGNNDKKESTFTRYEFEFEINCLRDFLKNKEEK